MSPGLWDMEAVDSGKMGFKNESVQESGSGICSIPENTEYDGT